MRPNATVDHSAHRRLLAQYCTGFGLSLVLTITAYALVTAHRFDTTAVSIGIISLALVQFIVQMMLFLHLGQEAKPRWKLYVFLAMVVVIIILVGGSLWIMNHLNYHQMSPEELRAYLHANEGL